MGLIETLIKDDVPRTATELANKTGGDKLLIGMSHVCLNYTNLIIQATRVDRHQCASLGLWQL